QEGEATGQIKVRLLDRRCNWQWWTDHNFKTAPPDAVLHFSGMVDYAKRLEAMRAWSESATVRS
ncbi:MAG TPA: hypothetical protein VFV87_03045, partial [Pirellulaceae bacterium]|nr:hypothetical protein [Pirellulaceae bacterium]